MVVLPLGLLENMVVPTVCVSTSHWHKLKIVFQSNKSVVYYEHLKGIFMTPISFTSVVKIPSSAKERLERRQTSF